MGAIAGYQCTWTTKASPARPNTYASRAHAGPIRPVPPPPAPAMLSGSVPVATAVGDVSAHPALVRAYAYCAALCGHCLCMERRGALKRHTHLWLQCIGRIRGRFCAPAPCMCVCVLCGCVWSSLLRGAVRCFERRLVAAFANDCLVRVLAKPVCVML